jgi:hypothetical protein
MPVSVSYEQARDQVERFAHNLDAYKRAFDRLLRDLKAEAG